MAKKPKAAKRRRINGRDTAGKTPAWNIRVAVDQRKRWELAAKRLGITVSEFVRTAADHAAGS